MQRTNLTKSRRVQENEIDSASWVNKNKNDNGKGKWSVRLHGGWNQKKKPIYRELPSEARLHEKLLHQWWCQKKQIDPHSYWHQLWQGYLRPWKWSVSAATKNQLKINMDGELPAKALQATLKTKIIIWIW